LQSKEKFLKTVSQEPETKSPAYWTLVQKTLDTIVGELPGWIFTGLDTKARVTVSSSACWEETRKDGGTAEAILQIMKVHEDLENPIPIRNLDSGLVTEFKQVLAFESLGEAVFWACLNVVAGLKLDELREVFLTSVKEPAKVRIVTKGRAALKIVLDTVSKICSYPLKKGFKSSESGMGKSNHGWNLFREIFSEEMVADIFEEDTREDENFVGYSERTISWKTVYASSTDYQEATDRMVHPLGRILGLTWMRKCGIPPYLRGLVVAVCYGPRRIYFRGKGHLSSYGESTDDPDIRFIVLRRGVLMGDPLTKVVLHLANILARRLGSDMTSGDAFAYLPGGGKAYDSLMRGIRDGYSLQVH
jgi:hypothetical protein